MGGICEFANPALVIYRFYAGTNIPICTKSMSDKP